jgi:Ca2+-binding EF-hand superfamily protein
MLDRFDTNHDGRVSEAEFVQGSLALFDAADANHDGVLTRQEAAAMQARMKALRLGDRR